MKQFFLFAVVALTLFSCGGNTSQKQVVEVADDVTQVLYFHTKQRCITCNAIEQLTKEVVDSLANEKIVMSVVDITQSEAIADKYEVTWSSLVLDRGGKVVNLTDVGFSYAKNQPQQFKTKLVEALQNIER